jgi:hypothetical protein
MGTDVFPRETRRDARVRFNTRRVFQVDRLRPELHRTAIVRSELERDDVPYPRVVARAYAPPDQLKVCRSCPVRDEFAHGE